MGLNTIAWPLGYPLKMNDDLVQRNFSFQTLLFGAQIQKHKIIIRSDRLFLFVRIILMKLKFKSIYLNINLAVQRNIRVRLLTVPVYIQLLYHFSNEIIDNFEILEKKLIEKLNIIQS